MRCSQLVLPDWTVSFWNFDYYTTKRYWNFQKEREQGKINSVLLNMRSHCSFKIEDSIAYIEKIIESMRREFVEYVLMDELCDLPKPCKDIHMSVCKVFDMFFNKKNRYDSDTEMLQDIKKALYDPVNIRRLS